MRQFFITGKGTYDRGEVTMAKHRLASARKKGSQVSKQDAERENELHGGLNEAGGKEGEGIRKAFHGHINCTPKNVPTT